MSREHANFSIALSSYNNEVIPNNHLIFFYCVKKNSIDMAIEHLNNSFNNYLGIMHGPRQIMANYCNILCSLFSNRLTSKIFTKMSPYAILRHIILKGYLTLHYVEYLAYVEKDYYAAINEIDAIISEFPKDKKYALAVKFDIARLFREYNEMENVIAELERDKTNNNTIIVCKSKLLAAQGQIEKAADFFAKNISYFTDESKVAFCEKLKGKTASPV